MSSVTVQSRSFLDTSFRNFQYVQDVPVTQEESSSEDESGVELCALLQQSLESSQTVSRQGGVVSDYGFVKYEGKSAGKPDLRPNGWKDTCEINYPGTATSETENTGKTAAFTDEKEACLLNKKLNQIKNVQQERQVVQDINQNGKSLCCATDETPACSSLNIPCQTQSQRNLATVSLSDLVKERKNDAANLFAANGKALVKTASQAPAMSLTDLAKQHKSKLATADSSRELSPIIPVKVQESMASLSDLVAQFSAQKKKLIQPDIVRGRSEKEDCEKGSSSGSLKLLARSSSSDLVTDCAQQKGNTTMISLSQLAHQRKQSGHPVLSRGAQANAAKSSLVSQMKNMTLGSTNAPSFSLSRPMSAEASQHVSLANCLKTKMNSSMDIDKPHTSDSKQATGHSHLSEIPSLIDIKPCDAYLDSYEKATNVALITQVSSLGLVLCCVKKKRKLEHVQAKRSGPLKYPKFACSSQVGHRKLYPESVYQKIEPFDFSTPSPDDIVKDKQKQAFTRSDKEFELPHVKDMARCYSFR